MSRPQPNSPPENYYNAITPNKRSLNPEQYSIEYLQYNYIVGKAAIGVVVFYLFYTTDATSQSPTRVKFNRVFFPRHYTQARSLGCGFAR